MGFLTAQEYPRGGRDLLRSAENVAEWSLEVLSIPPDRYPASRSLILEGKPKLLGDCLDGFLEGSSTSGSYLLHTLIKRGEAVREPPLR